MKKANGGARRIQEGGISTIQLRNGGLVHVRMPLEILRIAIEERTISLESFPGEGVSECLELRGVNGRSFSVSVSKIETIMPYSPEDDKEVHFHSEDREPVSVR